MASFYAFTANFISSNIAPALSLWFTEFPQEPKPFPELVYFIAVRHPLPTPSTLSAPLRAQTMMRGVIN